MTRLQDVITFRDDLYFDGAVQADWFYSEKQLPIVARSFVFHGPKNHAVTGGEFGGKGLVDTASFALRIAEKLNNPEAGSALTLAIAGYGTGKSHLAVTLSALLSGADFQPSLHEAILENIRRADAGIAERLCPLVKKPRLVLTLNGMRDFNLHYELMRTAEKALKVYGVPQDLLKSLNKVRETAIGFIEHSYDILQSHFEAAAQQDLPLTGEALRRQLCERLENNDEIALAIVNSVYTEFNGHPIRQDEGVSASAVLDTLLTACCGLHGRFDGIVILFDEFGRFLEYASAQPGAAGDSALQQIFESVQNAEGDIQFVGFIQSDIKSYLQRVDRASNISRYIDRYDAGEKLYLSSNLETIFANLLEKKDPVAFDTCVGQRLKKEIAAWRKLFDSMNRWLPTHGIWTQWEDFQRILLEGIYPMHPIATYLLCNLTDWLQNRSSLTLLSEKVRQMGDAFLGSDHPLPMIFPVDLLKGPLFEELLNAEEQGRQRSQFCILLGNIYQKFDTKLTDDDRSVLLSNLILRICRFRFESRTDLLEAMRACCNLSENRLQDSLDLLENEFVVLSYDERMNCFDFVADSVGANEFRNFLRAAQNRSTFRPEMLARSDVQELADLLRPIDTDFGARHGIQTREWQFVQRLEPLNNVTEAYLVDACTELRSHTLPSQERGLLLWVYLPKTADQNQLDELKRNAAALGSKQALSVFVLDDADDSLGNAIVTYRVLADMKLEDQLRYQRFYADALEKAKENIRQLFIALKQTRKVIYDGEIICAEKRLKAYLTGVLEVIYPKVISSDFDGFDAKTGVAYKNFSTIMRWILMDHMNYTNLKSLSVDVRNRVNTIFGAGSMFSWQVLTKDGKAGAPRNLQVAAVWEMLEGTLNHQKSLSLSELMTTLSAAPYGMNEYAAFMLLALFCENFSYTTRLEMDNVRYSTNVWAEQVIEDKRFNIKLLNRTSLVLVDVGESENRFRTLFDTIKHNRDFSKSQALAEQLEELEREESVPEALAVDYDLILVILDEGKKVEKRFSDAISNLCAKLENCKTKNNAYGALQVVDEIDKLATRELSSMFSYTAAQIAELQKHRQYAKAIAERSFEPWIKSAVCRSFDKLEQYKDFVAAVSTVFRKHKYVAQAEALLAQAEKEEKRIRVVHEKAALFSSCESYLASSAIMPGMTQKTLTVFVGQGRALLAEFENFNYQADERFVNIRQKITDHVAKLTEAVSAQRKRIGDMWEELDAITDLDSAQRARGKLHALLSSGLNDEDRTSLEEADITLARFLVEAGALNVDVNAEKIASIAGQLMQSFEDETIDLEPAIHAICDKRIADINAAEARWIDQWLKISPDEMDQFALDAWKSAMTVLPFYLSDETREKVRMIFERVERVLSKRRIDYILMLYDKLSDEEKASCMEALKDK